MAKKCCFIAITGTIGSGKTTVANILRDNGFFVFDADLFSKQILSEDKSIIKMIENFLGQTVSENNKLNFKKVGEILDACPILDKRFENWYQPFLGKKIINEMQTLELKCEEEIIFFDIPLLQQKGIAHKFDDLWIIESEDRIMYERIKKRNNYSDDKINYLLQYSNIDKELLLTDFKVIDNNHSFEKLRRLVQSELANLTFKYRIK